MPPARYEGYERPTANGRWPSQPGFPVSCHPQASLLFAWGCYASESRKLSFRTGTGPGRRPNHQPALDHSQSSGQAANLPRFVPPPARLAGSTAFLDRSESQPTRFPGSLPPPESEKTPLGRGTKIRRTVGKATGRPAAWPAGWRRASALTARAGGPTWRCLDRLGACPAGRRRPNEPGTQAAGPYDANPHSPLAGAREPDGHDTFSLSPAGRLAGSPGRTRTPARAEGKPGDLYRRRA